MTGLVEDIDFDSATTSYTVGVRQATASVTVTATPTAEAASVAITADTDDTISGSTVDLSYGTNVITITVTNGADTQDYTVRVRRLPTVNVVPVDVNGNPKTSFTEGIDTHVGIRLELNPGETAQPAEIIPGTAIFNIDTPAGAHSGAQRFIELVSGSYPTTNHGIAQGQSSSDIALYPIVDDEVAEEDATALASVFTLAANAYHFGGNVEITLNDDDSVREPSNARANVGATEITVDWTTPASGGEPTHYDVCILAAPMEINDTNCTGTAARTTGTGNHRQAAASTPEQTHTRTELDATAEYNIGVRSIGACVAPCTSNISDWITPRIALRLKLRVFLESALP